VQNSPFWTIHPYVSTNVTISDIKVSNPPGAPNTDGLDIDSCNGVLVQNIEIDTSDDHIAIKSGRGAEGLAFNTPSQNIVVQHSTFGIGAGLAIGSETAGSVRNVTFSHLKLSLSANLVRLKGCVSNGGTIENILYSDISLKGGYVAIFVRRSNSCLPSPTRVPNLPRHFTCSLD
jgi:polygalacturonase